MRARAGGELAIPHIAQLTAHRLLGDGDTELFENPLAKIDDPPAHDPMDRRRWASFDNRDQRRPMLIFEQGRLARRLAVHETVGTTGVKPQHSIPDDLKTDAPDPRRLASRRTVVNRRKREKPSRLRPILCALRYRSYSSRVEIVPKPNRSPHGEPPCVRQFESNASRFGTPLPPP